MRVGFKVESVALVSTRIWQGFPLILILVHRWLFKGITGNSLPKNLLASHQLWEGPIWRASLWGRYGTIQVDVEGSFFQCSS